MSRHTEYVPLVADWQRLKHHPLSALVDFGAGIDLDQLAAHMRENGYDEDEPIIILDGMIFDGRHRHKAAIMAEVEPSWRKFTGKDPLAYVRKKMNRQHLNESQRAMFWAAFTKAQNVGNPTFQLTQQEAAEAGNVSRELIVQAGQVREHGTPELVQAVTEGTIRVSDAVKIVAEPAKVQNRAVKDVKAGKAPTATAAVNIGYDPDLCAACNRNIRVKGLPATKNCPECKALRTPAKAKPATKPEEKPATSDDPCPKACGKCDCCRAWKAKAATSTKFVKPTLEEVRDYCRERKNHVDPEAFHDFYESKGWLVGKAAMKDWKAAVRTWEKNNYGTGKNGKQPADFYAGLKEFVARGEAVDEQN